jgi:hypothetical protein
LIFPPRDNRGHNNEQSECLLRPQGGWFFLKKNILIPNVAEKNILIMVEGKKII